LEEKFVFSPPTLKRSRLVAADRLTRFEIAPIGRHHLKLLPVSTPPLSRLTSSGHSATNTPSLAKSRPTATHSSRLRPRFQATSASRREASGRWSAGPRRPAALGSTARFTCPCWQTMRAIYAWAAAGL